MRKGSINPHLYRARIGYCVVCNNQYRAVTDFKDRKQKYCSKKCWNVRAAIINHCGFCGKEIRTYKSINKKYCGNECRNENYKKLIGEDSKAWKGDKAGYSAIHKWMTARYGKPTICAQCGGGKKVQWANKTGKYLRTLSDWLHLCPKCHRNYDNAKRKIKKVNEKKR